MIGFVLALASAAADPAAILGPSSPAHAPNKAFTQCLKDASERLYNTTDSSETIARGAMSVCGPQRIALSQALVEYFKLHQDIYEKPVFEKVDEQMIAEGQELARLFVLNIRSQASNAPNK